MSEKYNYIVIGAGISGLHIGALLSRYGKTLIFEKTKIIGGRARVEEIDGFKLDFGPHPIRFGQNSELARSLQELNKSLEFVKPGKSWACLQNGSKTIFPTGGIGAIVRSKMVPTLKTLKLIVNIKKMEDKDFEALYDTSLEDWFAKEKVHPKIQKFLTMASSAIQVNPFTERSSAGELLQNVKKILDFGSSYYPKGGWNQIFQRFMDYIKGNNGEIRLKEEVNEIVVENSRAIGVKVGNELIKGEKIISTIPVQQLFSILNQNLCEKSFVEKCKNLRPTAGVSIDFCLSKPITKIDGFVFFEKPPAFGFVPSNLSPEVAPPGKSLMTFLTIANLEDIKDKTKMKNIHQELRETILKFFPTIEDHLLHERPLFYEMIDGVEVNTEQHKFKRPGNKFNNIENLFITGDSVGGEGAGGDVGHSSVRKCYEMILKS